ncbi:MAG: hypothetical protein Q9212_000606 [Teloschistes hypoglaucus]
MAAITPPMSLASSLPYGSGQKGLLRYITRPPLGEPQFEMMKPIGDVHEVVIAIEEDSAAVARHLPPPPRVHNSPSENSIAPSFRLQPPTPPLAERPETPIPLTPSPTFTSPSRAMSSTSIDSSPRSQTSSPTLVRNGSTASTGTYSPVMRSMFPRYDPAVPLAQQSYYPRVEIKPAVAAVTSRLDNPGSCSPSLYSQQEPPLLENESNFCKTGLRLQNLREPVQGSIALSSISTPAELVDFWAIANGQRNSEAASRFTLELSCEDLAEGKEIICFDSSTSESLYTLSASGDDLSISRNHPTNDTTTIQISAPTLKTTSSSTTLIAPIFPKLAELMAIDQSSTVAVDHGLNRQACTELQTEAVGRAYRQEASSLLWDSESQKYHLIHPTLLEDDSPAAFPIEVTSSAGTPRAIKMFAPSSAKPVVELSFESLHVQIHIDAITSFSSLYLLDTLLSATLVLLLHLHRSRTSPSPSLRPTSAASALPYFEPPPTMPSPLRYKSKKDGRLTSWPRSFFNRPASQSNQKKTGKPLKDGDEESATITIQGSPDPSMTAKQPHPPTSTFQIVDPADERLPRTTRAVLRVLYWGFECLFWALGLLVNILAMGVVGLGKLVKIL